MGVYECYIKIYYSKHHSSQHGRNLVGTNNEHNVVEICRAANVMFHLIKPGVKCVKTRPVCYVVYQQRSLSVCVELVTNLTHRQPQRHQYSYLKYKLQLIYIIIIFKRHEIIKEQ